MAFALSQSVLNAVIKAVIYDLHGVLSKIDHVGVAQEIGFFDAVFYHLFDKPAYISHEKRLHQTLVAISGTQQPVDGHVVLNNDLEQLPELMCRWMDGRFDPVAEKPFIMGALKQLYCTGFFKNSREYRVIRNLIICMFFQPKRLNKHKKPIKQMLKMAQDIKAGGKHRQFLLSNIDALCFADLKNSQMGHALKQVIDTNDMIASALIRYNKPHPQAYLYIINLHGFDPSECVFIDDQLENVVAARKLGMIGLHVKDKNYKEIRRQLEALGVL